jgi:hypothetical protein
MSNARRSPESFNAVSKQKTVEDCKRRLETARLKLAQAKKDFRDQSIRERGRREREIGKAVLHMIEAGKLDAPTIALILDEVRATSASARWTDPDGSGSE